MPTYAPTYAAPRTAPIALHTIAASRRLDLAARAVADDFVRREVDGPAADEACAYGLPDSDRRAVHASVNDARPVRQQVLDRVADRLFAELKR
ncbi:MAG: hypothetical protein JWO31_2129 [Phycisphaerales bacterium]|nr:hypothetical protein [Phycisphaerales bacterium]